MGGKRPDQYRLDYNDSGATDYKFYPDRPKDSRRDYERYGRVMKGRAKAAQPVPPAILEPDVAIERAEELDRQEHIHEEEEGAEK